MKPIVWTIAGSDSGGGAGIQADLHVFRSLGVHGCSAITTITAQNSLTTSGLFPLSGDVLSEQISCLQQDLPPQAIKIGLLSTPEQLNAVVALLTHWPRTLPRPIVIWDPVIVSTQGDRLSQLTPAHCVDLLKRVDIVTPNASELLWLSDSDVHVDTDVNAISSSTLEHAVNVLRTLGARRILVTGLAGNNGTVNDYDFRANQRIEYRQSRIDSPHTHGTGCSLSSAIAAFSAWNYPMNDAITLANAYLHQGIHQAQAIGKGPGPVAHTHWPNVISQFPTVISAAQSTTHKAFPALQRPIGLYPVVDSFDWVKTLLQLGITTLQLRIKDSSAPHLESELKASIEVARQYSAQLFINDYWELAIKHQAYGVHLGQDDVTRADLTAIRDAGLRLGISTHGYTEIAIAHALQPSYIALGHVFPTPTKAMPSQPQGLERLSRYVALLAGTSIPTVAIGGISLDRAAAVMRTGVDGIAVVRAITEANDPAQTINWFKHDMNTSPELTNAD